jgi:hypothetical protein
MRGSIRLETTLVVTGLSSFEVSNDNNLTATVTQ